MIEGGSGPPLVLVHGRGGAATAWFPLLPHLARTHRVLAVDLPGFGASRGHRFTGGSAEEALAFFFDPVEAWLAAEGVTTPVVVGHSLGGLVALELALRGRIAPAGLGLIAAMGIGPEVTYPARLFFRAGPERIARAIGSRAFGRLISSTGPDAARRDALAYELYAAPGGREDASRAFDALVPLVGPALHRRERLHTIGAPTLVYWGDADEALPSPLAIAAAAELPRSVLRMVAGGHSPHVDDPAKALSILDVFLSSVIT